MPKIYTTFYGCRRLPHNAYRVQVSNTRPERIPIDYFWFQVFPDFRKLVLPFKSGRMPERDYRETYLAQLDDTTVRKGVDDILSRAGGRDVFLMCYCAKGAFCHRRILAEKIAELTGETVEEF